MSLKFVIATFVIVIVASEDDKKWVWKDNERSGKLGESRQSDEYLESSKASPRYEVFENEGPFSAAYRPEYERPGRPTFGQGGGFIGKPYPNRPGQGIFNPARPGGVYGQGNLEFNRPDEFGENYGQGGFGAPNNFGELNSYGQGGPGGVYGQGNLGFNRPNEFGGNNGQGGFGGPNNFGGPNSYGQGQFGEYGHGGVLGGPGFGKEPPFKHFDTCKCTERFNCNSPGISYGHCDIGKQYCCYVKKVGPNPSRPIHSPENGILVGPGGPTGIVGKPGGGSYPIRETYDGSPYDGDSGVLVGPGGPTGIIGRPTKGPFGSRPFNSPDNGILVGPGGPYDGPGSFGGPRPFDYRRSAKKN